MERAEEKDKYAVLSAKKYYISILLSSKKKALGIVNLHGHRSQAPIKVQMACGKSVKDLKNFLLAHPRTFTVIGDKVSLVQKKEVDFEVSLEKPKQLTKVSPLGTRINFKRIEKEKKDKETSSTSLSTQTRKNQTHQLHVNSTRKNKEASNDLQRGVTCYFEGNSWKAWKKSLIATIENCNSITQEILKFATNNQMIISLSCQSGCCNAKHQLSLLQIATRRGEAFVFDILTCPEMMTKGGLKSLLESNNVLKIIHNCSMISAHLQADFGVLLMNVLDTQSAHEVLQFQNHQKSVHEVQSVSLKALCAIYEAPANPLEKDLEMVLLSDENYWIRRPLSPDMLLYAVGDVLTLISQQLYGKINAILPENRDLLNKLCKDQIMRYISPEIVTAVEEDRESLPKVSELNDNNITNDQVSPPSIDLTEEKQEGPEKICTTEKNQEVVANVELDSDEHDWEFVFEKITNDLVQQNDRSPSVEILSSGNSESSNDMNVMSLMDSILADMDSGSMDELADLNVFSAAGESAESSVMSTKSTTDPDIGNESQLKITEEVTPVIDLTVEETPFLPAPVIQNTLEEDKSKRISKYDSVLVKRTDEDKRVTKRSATQVSRQYEKDPPTKIICLGLGERSPAFSPTVTDETTSCESLSEPPSPPHILSWDIHITLRKKE